MKANMKCKKAKQLPYKGKGQTRQCYEQFDDQYHINIWPTRSGWRKMRRCHTAVEEQKANYSVELIDVAYPGRIREPVNNHGESVLVQQRRRPGSKNVEEGRKRDQSEEREVKRELPQLRDGQDTVGMQRPMTFNIHNWQEWFSSFTLVAKMPLPWAVAFNWEFFAFEGLLIKFDFSQGCTIWTYQAGWWGYASLWWRRGAGSGDFGPAWRQSAPHRRPGRRAGSGMGSWEEATFQTFFKDQRGKIPVVHNAAQNTVDECNDGKKVEGSIDRIPTTPWQISCMQQPFNTVMFAFEPGRSFEARRGRIMIMETRQSPKKTYTMLNLDKIIIVNTFDACSSLLENTYTGWFF